MGERNAGFLVVDDGGWVLYANSVAQQYVKDRWDFHLSELRTGEEHFFTQADGTTLSVSAMAASLQWEGKRARAVTFEARSSLREWQKQGESNIDWAMTFDAIPDAILVLDRKGITRKINKAAALMLGVEVQKAPGKSFCNLAGNQKIFEDLCDGSDFGGRQSVTIEKKLAYNKGWVLISQMPLYDSVGRAKGNVVILRDITKHKKVEEALQKAESRYRDIFANAAIGIAQTTLDGRFLRVNPAFSTLLGYGSTTEMIIEIQDIGTQCYADAKERELFLRRLAKEGHVAGFETRMLKKSGETVWVSINCRMILDEENHPRFLDAFVSDITARKQAEQAFREQARLLNGVLEGMEAAVFIVDVDSHEIVEANSVAEGMYGNKQEKIIGQKCMLLLAHDGKQYPCNQLTEPVRNIETTVELPNGDILPVQRTIMPLEVEGKKFIVETLFDISERKALERQLTYTQKLESVGELAAGIAHEINTPIQYIGDNTRFLQDSFEDLMELHTTVSSIFNDSEAHANPDFYRAQYRDALKQADIDYLSEEMPRALKQTLEGVAHVSNIVKAMKQFSHPDSGESVLTDINTAIRNTVDISRNEWKYHAQVTLDLPEDLPLVECSPGDINQVLLNVLVNAAHAITEAVGDSGQTGSIDIKTRQDGDYVEISISDTGAGIPLENRDRVFNPFFTTKKVGKGTGQGLAICYNIVVKKHAGVLDFESELGKGTTFFIRLPIGNQQERHDAEEV